VRSGPLGKAEELGAFSEVTMASELRNQRLAVLITLPVVTTVSF
jgi:hypothetical protein